MPESFERGALTEAVYYILLSLMEPLHGYGIMKKVEDLSDKRVRLGAGTLYGALNTLLEKKWIDYAVNSDKNKKEYIITSYGQIIVENELKRLEELLNNGRKILEEKDANNKI